MKERASVLIVNRVYPPLRGATGRMMHDLARHFVKTGHKVTILATTPARSMATSRGNITIVRVKDRGKTGFWGYAQTLWRLYRAMLRMPRHDVIITMSDPPLLYVAGQRAAKQRKSAHAHWCQDLYPDLFPALGFDVPDRVLRRAFKTGHKALAQVDCVVAISRCMQRHLLRIGVDARHTTVIENWPDQELVNPFAKAAAPPPEIALPHKKKLQERRLYSDPAGQKFRVLYAGTLGRAHPVDAVIQAARILQRSQPDIELVFAGTGPGFEVLAHARAQFGLDNIRLMPPQPRASLRALMESGDVHLVTMKDEAMGMLMPSKFYSALGAARPVVFAGPPECDIARLIARHNCGRVVKAHDGKGLATAIALYRTDSEVWFAGQEGAKAALSGRLPSDAFALWSNVVKKLADAKRHKRTAR